MQSGAGGKLWPLWKSAVAILVLVDTRTRANKELEPIDMYATSCFQCLPAAPGSHCKGTLLRCSSPRYSCATTASTPDLKSVLTCKESSTHPCSLTNSGESNLYNITCSCDGPACNGVFTDHLVQNLTKFAAVNTKKEGELIKEYLKFANLSHLTDDELISIVFNTTLIHLWKTDLRPRSEEAEGSNSTKTVILEQVLDKHKRAESLPNPEALKNEATEPSDDDEDEGEGSGAEEARRPPAAAAPAAPSSFLPASANTAANNYFLNVIIAHFVIYTFT